MSAARPAPGRHSDDWYRARLALPRRRPRLVIDTDAANEIDDHFALAWALLSPDRLQLEAVYAAPYSFEHRRQEMLRARRARDEPHRARAEDHALLRQHGARLAHFERRGWNPATVQLAPFCDPGEGMRRSLEQIGQVFDALRLSPDGRVWPGSAGYLQAADRPQPSPAADHLIALARSMPDDEPLYVVAIGCVTNLVSAWLAAPDIADKIVVVWTSGYPSHAPQVNYSLNLEQDLTASRLLFDSGIPLVYLPGFHVGAQLRLSWPEVQAHVDGRGAIGRHLARLYAHNPLFEMLGIERLDGLSWVIWDLITIAWLVEPDWVPSDLVRTPLLGADRRWRRGPRKRPPMREAYAVARDAIFGDLVARLSTAPD